MAVWEPVSRGRATYSSWEPFFGKQATNTARNPFLETRRGRQLVSMIYQLSECKFLEDDNIPVEGAFKKRLPSGQIFTSMMLPNDHDGGGNPTTEPQGQGCQRPYHSQTISRPFLRI